MLNLNLKTQTGQLVFNRLIVFAEDTADDAFIQNDDIFILGVLFFVIAYNNGNLTILVNLTACGVLLEDFAILGIFICTALALNDNKIIAVLGLSILQLHTDQIGYIDLTRTAEQVSGLHHKDCNTGCNHYKDSDCDTSHCSGRIAKRAFLLFALGRTTIVFILCLVAITTVAVSGSRARLRGLLAGAINLILRLRIVKRTAVRSCCGSLLAIHTRQCDGFIGSSTTAAGHARLGASRGEAQIRVVLETLQIIVDIVSRCITLRQNRAHCTHDDVIHAARNTGNQFARERRLCIDMLHDNCDRRITVKGYAAGQHFVHDNAERVQVCAVIDAGALSLFGGNVVNRTDSFLNDACFLILFKTSDAEVGYLNRAITQQDDVVRLDILMDDAAAVRVRECLGDLLRKKQSFLPGQTALALQVILERDTLDQLHNNVLNRAVGGRDVEDRDDIVMGQLGNRL